MRVPRRTLRSSACFAVLVFAFLVAGTAVAQEGGGRTGAVLEFSGRRSAATRSAVVDGVSNDLELVAESDVETVAERLGADLATPQGIAAVATELGLSLVITGELSGSGRRARATIRIYDVEGTELGMREIAAVSGRRNQSEAEEAGAQLVRDAISQVEQREADRLAEQQAAADAARDRVQQEERERPRETAPPPQQTTQRAHPFITLYGGITIRTRDAEITREALSAATYSNAYPELTIAAELRPFADGALAGVIAQAELAYGLFLSSVDATNRDMTTGEATPIDSTTSYHFGLNAGYLLGLGAIELGGTVGFGYDVFALSENTIMGSAKYPHLRIAPMVRIAIIPRLLEAQVDLALRLCFGTGDIATRYAANSSALGFEALAGVAGTLDFGLSYAIKFGYVGYSLSLDGMPQATQPQGIDGSESALRVMLLAGYSFGTTTTGPASSSGSNAAAEPEEGEAAPEGGVE